MNIKQAFPSKFLKAEDLRGQSITLTIDRVESTEIDDDKTKPVVFFKGRKKGLLLNKTNAFTIAERHGDETDQWPGKQITVFPARTDFQGKRVPCIRVEVPSDKPTQDNTPTF